MQRKAAAAGKLTNSEDRLRSGSRQFTLDRAHVYLSGFQVTDTGRQESLEPARRLEQRMKAEMQLLFDEDPHELIAR